MSDLVASLSSGGQGAFDVVTLPAGGDSGSGRGPRASGGVNPAASVPAALRERIGTGTGAAQSYTRIVYAEKDKGSQPPSSSASRSTTPTATRTSCTTSSRSPRRRSR